MQRHGESLVVFPLPQKNASRKKNVSEFSEIFNLLSFKKPQNWCTKGAWDSIKYNI